MNKLMLLAASGAVLGLLSLLIIARCATAVEMKIDAVTEGDAGALILIRGRVQGIYESNGNVFFNLCSRRCIRIVVFERMAAMMKKSATDLSNLRSGDVVAVQGIVEADERGISLRVLDYNSLQVEGK
ncbi:MAG: OB-fold nucleic acid binding domain-containing protein [Candidatus Micrarchaeota archaeon]